MIKSEFSASLLTTDLLLKKHENIIISIEKSCAASYLLKAVIQFLKDLLINTNFKRTAFI